MASLLLIRKEDLTGNEFVVLTESDDPEENQREWVDPGYVIAAAITIREGVRSWPTERLWQVT